MLGPGDRNARIDRIPEIAWRLPFWFCQMSAAVPCFNHVCAMGKTVSKEDNR